MAERGGLVRVVEGGELLGPPLAAFRPAEGFGAGLLGIALHPGFEENGVMYAYMSYGEGGEVLNRIVRITESGNRLAEARTILDGIPGSRYTNGGLVKFGPDGMLYAGTGTPSEASHLPQDPGSLAGKVLRIDGDGGVPGDNPFPGSPVYALGFRNPQGIAWDAEGRMYVADLGPEKNDEINEVEAGGNYGWPGAECAAGPGSEAAAVCYDPGIGPGGMLFYSGGIDFGSPLLMASLGSGGLYRLDPGEGLASQKPVLGGVGRVRDVAEGPGGSVYGITSNTDGKGFPGGGDDRLLRITE